MHANAYYICGWKGCYQLSYGGMQCGRLRCVMRSSKERRRGAVMKAGGNGKGKGEEEGGKYKHTLDLPHTSFSMRANSTVREPEIQKLWEQKNILHRVAQNNCDGEPFTLHDGPPYANGHLHIGHALNKILKDFINRFQLLQGRKVLFVPGWDCHGLPIELKVLQSLEPEARLNLTPIKLRKKACQFALKAVDQQRNSFKRYGVWADWENPYLTLSPDYEAAQIELFGQMLLSGHIYRGRKPVHWSPSSSTALAEAELEYEDAHTSRSIYAAFRVTHPGESFPQDLKSYLPSLYLAIWTTTPWTLPGNAAVAVNDKITYAIVEVLPLTASSKENSSDSEKSKGGKRNAKLGSGLKSPHIKYLVVAGDLISTLQDKWQVNLQVKGTILGSALEYCRYIHPLEQRDCPVVIGGDYITTETGTGLVHTAPGHGQEDYATGQKYNLPLLSPVDDAGNFTKEAGKFAGLNVLDDGSLAIVKALDEQSNLLMEEAYVHKYPYDWRTKKPTIVRATKQWFASVDGFRNLALEAIGEVEWVPPQGKNRITAMVEGRSDWCISRQRTWGVPIPVFYHKDTGEPLMNNETISYVKSIIEQKGSDAWWYMDVKDLLPESLRNEASNYVKGSDTMDVWFDSGSSWAAVVMKRDGLCWPADLYLEGSDQHRGWFQSSLLTSIATRGRAPYKKVLTHGFVLDEKGVKMSKSVGNVVDPRLVIEGGKNQKDEPGYGADVLRLWVASVDYTGDILIGPQILRQLSDVYRKLRGTLRYLLSNLHGWNPENSVAYNQLPSIDKYALFQLANVIVGIKDSFSDYQFYRFYQLVQRFVVVDLSNFYFDIAKDRLYVGGRDSFTRKSCQTVLAAHLLCLVRAIAPVLPHLAEDAWQHLPFSVDGCTADSVFEARWPIVDERWKSMTKEQLEFWGIIIQVRADVNKVLEAARAGKLIGASLDAKIYLHSSDESLYERLKTMAGLEGGADKLSQIFITSQVEVVQSKEVFESLSMPHKGSSVTQGFGEIWIGVTRAEGMKCERCWNYSVAVGQFEEHPTLCKRCYGVVKSLSSHEIVFSL